ncbi:MAG: hypothetical protein ACFFA3_21050, partial [Promethearchaeota archaeon]
DLSDVGENNIVENQAGYNSSSVLMQRPSIDPALKTEIEGFLHWINNPSGLGGYIAYALQQNNIQQISQLAELYNEFYKIFYE